MAGIFFTVVALSALVSIFVSVIILDRSTDRGFGIKMIVGRQRLSSPWLSWLGLPKPRNWQLGEYFRVSDLDFCSLPCTCPL